MAGKDKAAASPTFSGQVNWILTTGKGGWFPDGSFDPAFDFWGAPPGSLTRAIRQLVWMRRNDRHLTPKRCAAIVKQCGFSSAFPYREKWLKVDEAWRWAGVGTSTSAESVVKYAGQGCDVNHGLLPQ